MKSESKIKEVFPRIKESQEKALKKLGIKTVRDLLYYFPSRYSNTDEIKNTKNVQKGDKVIIYARVKRIKATKAYYKKIPLTEATLEDSEGVIQAVWFRQPYISKMLSEGTFAKFSGTISERNGRPYLANPEYEISQDIPAGLFKDNDKKDNFIYPIYPESKGVSSQWIYHNIKKIFESGLLEEIEDPIPEKIIKKYNLPSLKTALIWIHSPKKEANAQSAKKRFAFEEIFFIQLLRQKQKKESQEKPSFKIEKTKEEIKKILESFTFDLTKAQKKSIEQIFKDFKSGHAMSRLLEGDVGSGKTAVAAAISNAIVTTKPNGQNFGNLQIAYMAPTEVLSKQLFESFIQYFSEMNINVGLITSHGCRKFPSKSDPSNWTNISRPQLLKWVSNGEIPILIGTHSLIQKTVEFKDLACVIIDEQHRFGVSQRQAMLRKSTQINADNKNTNHDEFLYKDLSYLIRGIAFTVFNNLGPGHKEIVYQNAIKEELLSRKIKFDKEKQIDIKYKNKKIGVYQPDFIIDDKIILELKSLPRITQRENKQLWNYIKGSEYKLAFLINFGAGEIEIKRVVYDTARNQRESAYNLRESAQQVSTPHLLSMTATPIPRTLALTIYGDLDLTLLDQMPSGRKPIITEIVTPDKREKTYSEIRKKLEEGRQLYVICPRIEEPDPDKAGALRVKSVQAEAKRLKKEVFPEYEIDILHSKMTPDDKEETMRQFENKEIDILVATSVVEVGVNVPNATMIIIEGAERFGLAQLHQLRGRVIRSNHQAYCFVFSDAKTDQTINRLKALKTAKNGFELAEADLLLRGAGELSGGKQWGISDIGMEAIKNIKIVEFAREEAKKIIGKDFELKKYPLIAERLEVLEVHFE